MFKKVDGQVASPEKISEFGHGRKWVLSFQKSLHVVLATSMILASPLPAMASGASSSGGPNSNSTPDVCETRRELSMQERDILMRFNADLSWLDRVRAAPDRNGVTYEQKFNSILAKNDGKFESEELKDAAGELVLFEQFKQLLFNTVGLDNPEFTNYLRVFRQTEYFAGGSPREIRDATAGLQQRLVTWNQKNLATIAAQQSQNASDADDEKRATATLKALSQTENVMASLDVVTQMLNHKAKKNSEQNNDRLASYGQYFWTFLGGTAVVGTLAVSGPVVSTASASLGAAGVLMAGCSIGAVGGGAAAVLQNQYQRYADAWIESANHKTSFACELRRAVENNHETLFSSFREGALHGGAAGCIFTGSGMVAPQLTVYSVTGAVVIATGAEGYSSFRAFQIYRSLMALQRAELSADQPEKAAEYLRQAQEFAKASGAHALNSVIVGIVLLGGPKEIQHAIHAGREAVIALIGKSSDNAAVAVNLLLDSVSGSKQKAASQTQH